MNTEPKASFMIDVETLATTSRAMPWQVGWTNMTTLQTTSVLLNPFQMRSLAGAFDDDPNTRLFILNNNEYAEEWLDAFDNATQNYTPQNVDGGGAYPVVSVITLYKMLCDDIGQHAEIWAKGADFDFPILKHLFSTFDLSLPWHFRNQGCLRSMEKLVDRLCPDHDWDLPKYAENAHDAGHDALHQTHRFNEFMEELVTIRAQASEYRVTHDD